MRANTHTCMRFIYAIGVAVSGYVCKYTHMHEIHLCHQHSCFSACVQVHTHAWDSFMPSAFLFLCMRASTHTRVRFIFCFLVLHHSLLLSWHCTLVAGTSEWVSVSARCSFWISTEFVSLTAPFGCCVSSDATQNSCHLGVHSVHTIQQCTNLQCWVTFYIIHQTLTWTTGSLMCICDLFACALVSSKLYQTKWLEKQDGQFLITLKQAQNIN